MENKAADGSHDRRCIRERFDPLQLLKIDSILDDEGNLTPRFQRVLETTYAFKFSSHDVILCSYFKCDNKIVEAILWKLLKPNQSLPEVNTVTNRYLHCFEVNGFGKSTIRQKLLKTHLPYAMVPHYSRSKFIYVIRNPWSTIVSCYKTMKIHTESKDTFDSFFERFVDGRLGYGRYFDEVLSWYRHLEDERVLILSCEFVKSEPRSALFVIAAFLGERHLHYLLNNDDKVLEILKFLDAIEEEDKEPASFQEEKSVFSREQLKLITDIIAENLKNTGVGNLWKGMLQQAFAEAEHANELSTLNSRFQTDW